MTDDLIAFVRARLDEDEAAARTAISAHEHEFPLRPCDAGGRWAHRYGDYGSTEVVDDQGHVIVPVAHDKGGALRIHIARHDPARALADIDTKRNLLSAVVAAKLDYDHWHARPPADPEFRAEILAKMTARWSAWSYVLTQLAVPHADHPDYREA